MSIDVVSISIKAESSGIDQATKSLNNLADASDRVEKAVSKVGEVSKSSSDTASQAASAIDKLLVKYQATVDLQGSLVSQQYAYTAAIKGGSEAQQSAAAFLGAEVDAYKALSSAQAEGLAMNKAIDSSYQSLSKQADAYYESQARIAAAAQALNDAGYRAQEYKKLSDAQSEALRMNSALDASYKSLEADANKYYATEAANAQRMRELNAAGYQAMQYEKLKDAKRALSDESKRLASAEAQEKAIIDANKEAGDRFVQSLKLQAESAGLTGKALRDYNAELLRTKAAQLGVTDQTSGFIQKLQDTEKASGHAASGASGITRELIVLGHEASQGQFSRFGGSLIVLGERLDIGGKAVKTFTAALEASGTTAGVLLTTIGAVVIAVGTLAAGLMTWLHSTQAIHEFNKELILTGNSAGTTGEQLYGMADKIGRVNGSIGDARKAVNELAASGRFSVEQIKAITEAAVGLSVYGGQAIDVTIKQFEKLAKDPLASTEKSFHNVSKAAMELDQQLHFLEPSTMQAIINQEDLGKSSEASAIAIKALSETEKDRTEELKKNMTWLGEKAHDLSAGFTNMWNSLWVKQPIVDQLAKLNKELAAITPEQMKGRTGQLKAEDLQNQIADIAVKMSEDQVKADTKAYNSATNTAANIAKVWATSIKERAKGDTMYQQMLEKNLEMEAALRIKDANDELLSVTNMAKRREDIKKLYGDKEKKIRAEGSSGIDAELKAIVAASEEQKKTLEGEVSALEAAYKAKKISVFDYVDQKDTKLKAEQALTTETYAKEVTAILLSEQQANRTASELNILAGKRSELYKKWQDDLAKNSEATLANSNLISDLASKSLAAQIESDKKALASTQATVDKLQDKVNAYKNLPDAIKKAGVTEKQLQDEITGSYINRLKEEQAQLIENNNVEDPLIKARLEFLDQEINKRMLLKNLQNTDEAQQAANKAIQEYNTAWKQANKQIGDDLASAIIDGGGKGWKKLIKDMELAFAKMILRPILEPISSSIASLVTNVGAISPGAVGGSANGAIGLAQTASNIYDMVSKGVTGISSAFTTLSADVADATQFLISGTTNVANGAFATGVGTIASQAAGVAAGHMIGNFIAGDYSVAHGQAVTNVSAIVGSIVGGPIGGAIGGAIGGLINRVFGMGSKNTTSQGISGTISDSGVTGQSYQNWTQKGGLFRSDKSGQDIQALGTDVTNTLASGLTSLKAVSTDFAKNLNVSSNALENYSKTFDITLTSDTTKNQQAITDFFTTMGDDIATKLIPNIADFSKTGETASATLQRLSDTFKATNSVMNLFGIDVDKVFGGIGLESAKARQYLVDLAGGISNLSSQASYFATNFLTDAEKIAPVQRAVSEAFKSLNIPAVSTIEQFKNLVKGIDLSTQAGAQLFENLMQLAPAFKQVVDTTEAAAKAAKDLAAATAQQADEALAAKKAAEDSAFKTLQGVAASDFAVLSKAIAKAKSDAQAAYDAQAAILNAQVSSLSTVSSAINQLVSSLESSLNSMIDSTVLGMSRASAQATLDDVIKTAKSTGVLPTSDSLKGVLSTLNKDASGSFSSYTDYIKDLGITAGKITDLKDLAKDQGTVVDQQLQVAKDQLAQAKVSFDLEIAKQDMLLSFAQQQLDAVNGVQVAVLSLAQALANFNQSSQAAVNYGTSIGAIPTAQAATPDQITSLYQNILHRAPDAAGLAWWENQASTNGATASQIAQGFLQSAEYRALQVNGSHANGLDSVPFDGYTAKLHKGEMVLPAKQAQGVAQGSDMKAVVEAINNLKEDNSSENQAAIGALVFLKKLFQNMTPSGDRIQTYEVGAPT